MKKLLAITLALMALSTSAFAMAKKPNFNTKYGCYQRPYYECKQYGNPWTTADMSKWNACAEPIYQECQLKYVA